MTPEIRALSARIAAAGGNGTEECWMEIDGAQMRYLRAGSGPALILLHGLMGYSFSWRFTMTALAPYATLYAPDMFGAGFSERPRNLNHSMRATARRVIQFARKLGLSTFDLLGTSRGGAVAMCMAAECQGNSDLRVRKLILVAPVNPYSSHGTLLAPFFGSLFGAALFRGVIERMDFLYSYLHSRMFGDPRRIPPDSLEGYRAPLAIPGLFEHALSIVKTWTSDLRELQALLPQIASIPTLLMWGSADPAVYATSADPLARHFSNVRKVIFPGIGHLPYEECPAEFNRALIEFLAEKASNS